MFDDRRSIGSHKVLPLSKTKHQRASLAGNNQRTRFPRRNHAQAVSSFDMLQSPAHRVLKRNRGLLFPHAIDEMHKHFRIGRASENIAVRRQLQTERHVVFYDPVVDNGNIADAVKMRMRVAVTGIAMRCPTSMGNAKGGPIKPVAFFLKGKFEILHAPFLFYDRKISIQNGNAGRVVSAILQPLEARHGPPQCVALPYETGYAAHPLTSS